MLKKLFASLGKLITKKSYFSTQDVPEDLMEIYKETYPILIHLHEQQSLAPYAVSMSTEGKIQGEALVIEDGKEITVEFALDHFTKELREKAKLGNITASAIFYHGHINKSEYRPAQTVDEANAIIGYLENKTKSLVFILPYFYAQDSWNYKELILKPKKANVFSGFTVAQESFFPSEYKSFEYAEGDLLAWQNDKGWQVTKILKIDEICLEKGESINIQGQEFIAPIPDCLLVISTSLSIAYDSLDTLKKSIEQQSLEFRIGHMPQRTGGIGKDSILVGNEEVGEGELSGYQQWRQAFDAGEAGVF